MKNESEVSTELINGINFNMSNLRILGLLEPHLINIMNSYGKSKINYLAKNLMSLRKL
jgi:hypothetical protein